MKKVLLLIVLLLLPLVLLTGCSEEIIKTEYQLNEEAKMDDLVITLTDASYNNGVLEAVFKITNNRKNSVTISPNVNFKLYDINKVQIPNIYSNDTSIIKKGETINYTLQYNVTGKSLYEILFYSGIVENNIKFSITNLNS